MARHGMLRARPHELLPSTLRVISVRMNYLPAKAAFASTLKNPSLGYVSRYALGRDYYKVLRNRLKQLGERIRDACGEVNFRPFVDSAPIIERPLAAKAGIGWVGKHSIILNCEADSWFFLGELLINLPLPVDASLAEQCGRCVACITTCPTGASVKPYTLDARRCISYLTIELEGKMPEALRLLIGNRIYGCDDCYLICPWNRFSQLTDEPDFSPRAVLHAPEAHWPRALVAQHRGRAGQCTLSGRDRAGAAAPTGRTAAAGRAYSLGAGKADGASRGRRRGGTKHAANTVGQGHRKGLTRDA